MKISKGEGMKGRAITALVAVGMMMSVANADVVSKNGVAKDTVTGLMWQDDDEIASIKKDWEGAKQYCQDLRLGGYKDWRLPNIYDLSTLLDNTKNESPFVINGLENTASDDYWSSSSGAGSKKIAWLISFNHGGGYISTKDDSLYVRCVRGGQLNSDTFALLKKQGKVKISQENIDKINPTIQAQRKKEAEIFQQQARQQSNNSSSREYISWKVAFKFDSSSGTAQTSKIECSNGKHGFAEYFYNSPGNYYVGGVMNRSLDEAANYICGNR